MPSHILDKTSVRFLTQAIALIFIQGPPQHPKRAGPPKHLSVKVIHCLILAHGQSRGCVGWPVVVPVPRPRHLFKTQGGRGVTHPPSPARDRRGGPPKSGCLRAFPPKMSALLTETHTWASGLGPPPGFWPRSPPTHPHPWSSELYAGVPCRPVRLPAAGAAAAPVRHHTA